MTTDRLAALLHEAVMRVGWASCVHSPENEWLPFCEVAAARLAQRGVTVAAQPAEDGPCAVCKVPRDRGVHDTWEVCDETRGPCLDPDRHHPYQPAPDALRAAAQAVVEAWDARDYTNRSEHWMTVADTMPDLRAALEGGPA